MVRFLILFVTVLLFAYDEDFLKTLNQVNEIATQTKLNIDKTPSNVYVLDREFIEKSGAKTLYDLLQFIPGIELAKSSSGKKEIIIRGNKSIYRDKIKFMINGVSVTNNLYSNQFYYYNFPASLIKRIEFTKTPDSVLYGGNAFIGLINVVTLNEVEDNKLSFYISNKNEKEFSIFQKMNNLLVDAYYSYSNPYIKGESYLVDIYTKDPIFYREGSANTHEKNAGFGITLKEGRNSFSYRLQAYKKGNFFGLARLIPLEDDKYITMVHQYFNFSHNHYLMYNLKNSINMGVKFYRWSGDFRLFPYDFNEAIDNNPENDVIAGADIDEIEYYFKDSINYITNLHNAIFLIELKFAKTLKDRYYQEILGYTQEDTLLIKGISRYVKSLAFQDLLTFSDNFSFIAGIRYDNYSDFGGKFSYKAGGVFNLKNSNFKILYNNAFRIPSWVELYSNTIMAFNGDDDLRPETIDMIEAIFTQYINKNSKFKITYFYGKDTDFIGKKLDITTGKRVYANLGDYYIRGAEFEYDYITSKLHFNFSYSLNRNYFDISQDIAGIDIYEWPGNRKNLIKSFIDYKLDAQNSIFLSSFWGSKINLPYIRDINEYFTLNVNFRHKLKKGEVIIGVDNLTNHENYYFVGPTDLLNEKYFFSLADGREPTIQRKIYLTFSKKW